MKTHHFSSSIILRLLFVSIITLLCMVAQPTSAQSENSESKKYAYRVTSSSKTLIQIARDVYGDERAWKKIAYWNNIKPPYSLQKGQILVLPSTPANQIDAANQVAENNIPKPEFLAHRPSVDQKVESDNKAYIYHVSERAPSLNMVALDVYGNKKMAPLIAKWNRLTMNSKLSLGQKLILKVEPKISIENSNTTLANYWMDLGNKDMAERILGHEYAGPLRKIRPSNQSEKESAKVFKPLETQKTSHVTKPEVTPMAVEISKPVEAVNAEVQTTAPTKAANKSKVTHDLPEKPVVSDQPSAPIVDRAAEKQNSQQIVDPELEQEKASTQVAVPKNLATPVLPQVPTPTTNPASAPQASPPKKSESTAQQTTDSTKPTESVGTPTQVTPTSAPKAPVAAPPVDQAAAASEKAKPENFKEPTTENYWLGEDTHTIYRTISNEQKN